MAWVWIVIAILYILSPYDLLPDFIPVRGWIDDAVVMVLLYRYVAKILSQRRSRGKKADREQSQEPETPNQNSSSKNPYEVLGISPAASREQIHSAYRKLVNQYHPDKVAHLGREFQELAEERFKEIQRAYQHIVDS